MDAVHREAADFLSGLLKQRQAGCVIISRQQSPRFFVGFKPSGVAVWSHDARLGKKFDGGSVELSDAIGELRGLEDVEIVVGEKAKAVRA